MGRGAAERTAPLVTAPVSTERSKCAVLLSGDASVPGDLLTFELPEGSVQIREHLRRRQDRSAVELDPGQPFTARVLLCPAGEPYLVDADGLAPQVHRLAESGCARCGRDDCPHAAAARALVLEGVPLRYPETARWRSRASASFTELRAPRGRGRMLGVRVDPERGWALVAYPGLPRTVRLTGADGCAWCSGWRGGMQPGHCLHAALYRATGPRTLLEDLEDAWASGRAAIDTAYPPRIAHSDLPELYAEAGALFDGEQSIDLCLRTGRGPIDVLRFASPGMPRDASGLAAALRALLPRRPAAPASEADLTELADKNPKRVMGKRRGRGWSGNIGGMVPVQGEGTVDGLPFYFRARGTSWELSVAARPGADPVDVRWGNAEGFTVGGEYGSAFEAGYMSLDHAWTFARASFEELRRHVRRASA